MTRCDETNVGGVMNRNFLNELDILIANHQLFEKLLH